MTTQSDTSGGDDRQQTLTMAISNEMVRLYKDLFGRGPTKARTVWGGPDTQVPELRVPEKSWCGRFDPALAMHIAKRFLRRRLCRRLACFGPREQWSRRFEPQAQPGGGRGSDERHAEAENPVGRGRSSSDRP
jgi:hypothetical protein